MLLIIETQSRTGIVKIDDTSHESISAAFELIDHPEFTIKESKEGKIATDVNYNLYDWDDVAAVMVEQNKESLLDVNLEDVECIGTIKIIDNDYVWMNGDIVD